ncbi:META domain-containing protein [Variovorax dokdonensis]|uniref:META domain-containing protein n=1 Tax=Variovorax dokdonensis TaxID=344883 RepID=A0ABT7N933_9BURK|nr:META domain-containing protein [Variovorax dokdonensis]MDM0044456.1 META domain-containing protein [Variovorax dokdonensis]
MRFLPVDLPRFLPWMAVVLLSACAGTSPQGGAVGAPTGMPPAPLLSGGGAGSGGAAGAALPADDGNASYSLTGTRWQLMEIQSTDGAAPPARPADPARYTVQFGPEGRAVFQVDCNRGQATWQVDRVGDGHTGPLRFMGISIGQTTCGVSPLGPRVAAALPLVRGYMIRNGRLYMSLEGDEGLLTWNGVR